MKDDVLIDYAYHAMMAETALKKLHNKLLDNDFDEAVEAGIQALADVKLTINAIKHMKEKRHALREQA